MRNWNEIKDRRAATLIFRDTLEANPQLKLDCCNDPNQARRQFAILGEFYLEGEVLPHQEPNDGTKTPIPQSVQFKVYDAKDPKRHDLAVLVLPSQWGDKSTEPTDIWIAAWPNWGSVENEIARLAARLNMLGQELAQREM
jgi:hypothetical protein